MTRTLRGLLLVLTALTIFACAPKAPVPPPKPAPPPPPPVAEEGFRRIGPAEAMALAEHIDIREQRLDSWRDLAGPLSLSLSYLESRPQDALALDRPELRLTWAQLTLSVRRLLDILPLLDADPSLLGREFVWYTLDPDPLMTGYYAPMIDASPVRAPGYEYPLYGRPSDLQSVDLGLFHPRWEGQQLVYRVENGRVVPYFDRRQIEMQGALAGRGLEIAWTRHPWDVYHLQVQGSGYLRFPDGRIQPVLYAGKNGHAFVSSERLLLSRGHIEPGAMHREGIREALKRMGPGGHEILAENPSYVFFTLSDSPPLGSMGRPVTAYVSLATDPKLLPLGSIVPFSADLPTGPGEPRRAVQGIGLAQDTGGVIKGGRIDYYCGAGEESEYIAFRIKNPVRVHILVHRDALGGGQP